MSPEREIVDDPKKPVVSIVIPVFNERNTIQELLQRVLQAELYGLEKEIVIVDDGSTDGTATWLREFPRNLDTGQSFIWVYKCGASIASGNIKVLFHAQNQGKGAALCRGFQEVCGDMIIVQDADLEYDPNDYERLLMPILNGQADVVYGSRFLDSKTLTWTTGGYLGNKFITMLSNVFTGLSLTDVWTGYKVFKRSVIQHMVLREPGFEMELELTSKIAHASWRICEVPISYRRRTRAEGKKITWKNGIKAIRCMIDYRWRKLDEEQNTIRKLPNAHNFR